MTTNDIFTTSPTITASRPKRRRSSSRAFGFSLIELLSAMTIGGIIAASATSAMVLIMRSTNGLEREARVDQEAKLLLDYLLSNIQELGGGSVRPNVAISIHDNNGAECASPLTIGAVTLPPCNGSDRLHIAVLDDDAPQCQIKSFNGTTATLEPTSGCCGGLMPAPGLEDLVVMILDTVTGGWETRYCNNFTDSPGTCKCTFSAGQSGYNVAGGGWASSPKDSVLVAGKAVTFFVDNRVLMMASDINSDGVTEIVPLAPNLFDFQVDLGFDVDGDTHPDTYQPSYVGVPADSIRVARIGLILGERTGAELPVTSVVLNGNPVTMTKGWALRTIVGATGLRNLYLFN